MNIELNPESIKLTFFGLHRVRRKSAGGNFLNYFYNETIKNCIAVLLFWRRILFFQGIFSLNFENIYSQIIFCIQFVFLFFFSFFLSFNKFKILSWFTSTNIAAPEIDQRDNIVALLKGFAVKLWTSTHVTKFTVIYFLSWNISAYRTSMPEPKELSLLIILYNGESTNFINI